MPEFIAEAPPSPLAALQIVDTAEGMIVIQHDCDLPALLHRGDDLGMQHQVAAIAEKRVDLARGVGEFHAERAGDLISHARVTIFGMVVGRRLAAPKFVDVAGNAARTVHDRAARVGELVQHADHLALVEQTVRAEPDG